LLDGIILGNVCGGNGASTRDSYFLTSTRNGDFTGARDGNLLLVVEVAKVKASGKGCRERGKKRERYE
jgi:hypothetical protein